MGGLWGYTSPNLDDPCVLLFVLLLATSVGPSEHRPLAPLPGLPPEADTALRRSRRIASKKQVAIQQVESLLSIDQRRQQAAALPVDRARAQVAADWTAYFTSKWRRAIAQELESDPAALAGARLVDIVSNHHRRIVGLRRRNLQSDHAFLHRDRDPQAASTTGTGSAASVNSSSHGRGSAEAIVAPA